MLFPGFDCDIGCINDANLLQNEAPDYGLYPRIMGLAGLVPNNFVKDIKVRMKCDIKIDEIDVSMLILDHVTRMLKKKIILRRWKTWTYDDGG